MSFQTIQSLRKAGRLDEALRQAEDELAANPHDLWLKRALGWIAYDYLKLAIQQNQPDSFLQWLSKIRELRFPDSEVMLFDQVAWQIGSFIYNVKKSGSCTIELLNHVFECISTFYFTKPSSSYSFLLRAFIKKDIQWPLLIDFIDWWNLQWLRPEDYLPEIVGEKKITPTAEQALMAYSKACLERENTPIAQLSNFITLLNDTIDQHPEYLYLPYFKGKLLLKFGDKDEAMKAFLPFARLKQNEFWIWEILSTTSEDDFMQIACLAKALSLKTPEHFLVKVRQKMASLLIKNGLFVEASIEISKIITCRNSQDWPIPREVKGWMNASWFQINEANSNIRDFYARHLHKAEMLLYQDVEEYCIAIEHVNDAKGILSFIRNNKHQGFCSYQKFIKNPKRGDIYWVRFQKQSESGFHSLLTLRKAKIIDNCEAVKSFQGNLKMQEGKLFGFVGKIMIEQGLIESNQLKHGDNVAGKAIMSFNKKKNQWGWKAFTVAFNLVPDVSKLKA